MNEKNSLIANFEKAVEVPLNFAILIRANVDELRKVVKLLEAQNNIQIVFTDVSADPIWFTRSSKEDEKEKR